MAPAEVRARIGEHRRQDNTPGIPRPSNGQGDTSHATQIIEGISHRDTSPVYTGVLPLSTPSLSVGHTKGWGDGCLAILEAIIIIIYYIGTVKVN